MKSGTTTFQSHYVVAAVPEAAEAVCSAGMAAAAQVLVGEAGGLWPELDLQQMAQGISSLRCCSVCDSKALSYLLGL